MLFVLGLLGLWRLGARGYLWSVGVGITGMILTKETYAIHVACALLAIPTLAVSYALSNRVNPYWGCSSGCQACKANLELDRSRHDRDRRRICHRLFLFGNIL